MNKNLPFSLALSVCLMVGLSACDSDSVTDDEFTGEATLVTDVAADPGTGRDPNNGQLLGTTGHYTLFSLRENKIVSSGDSFSAADSASSAWDIGFRSTSIIINGGTSGPGQGAAVVVEGAFEEMAMAPETGYKADGAEGFAIPSGSGNGWYNYNPALMVLSPIPGRVIAVRTADGRYAKVRIISYYKGAPDPVDPFMDQERFYTFEFVFQPDGSRKLQ